MRIVRGHILWVLALPSMVACQAEDAAVPQLPDERCVELEATGACALYGVSLVELIANPTTFHGKRVRLIGYVLLEFEGNSIYLSKESFAAGITKNALWLEPPANFPPENKGAKRWGPRYAIVEGRFNATDHGHMDLFSGAIRDTTRLDAWNVQR